MNDLHLTLSQHERDFLVRLLTDAQRHKRVEVRRTEFSHEFREQLEAEEQLLEELTAKLAAAPAAI